MRRFLKFLHTVGAVGLMGGLAAYMLVVATTPDDVSLETYAAIRTNLAAISRYLVVPSLGLVMISGVLSMAATFQFQNAGWVWLKAGAGILIFEAMLANVDGPARHAAVAAQQALAGEIDRAEMALRVRDAWGAWWTLLTLAVANVVLATWRPRFVRRRREPVSPSATIESAGKNPE